MPSDRVSLLALRGQIADRDGTVETELPQNRTAHRRENLRAALALIDDLTGRHAAPSTVSADSSDLIPAMESTVTGHV